MKKKWMVALALAALLCGCDLQPEEPTTEPAPPTTQAPTDTSTTEPTQLPEPTQVLTVYEIPDEMATEFRFMGEKLVLSTSSEEGFATLTLAEIWGDAVIQTGSYEGYVSLMADNTVTWPEGIALWQRKSMEYVLLDRSLKEVRRISLPQEPVGEVYLAQDLSAVFYCTESGLWRLDTATQTSRLLVEPAHGSLTAGGLLFDGRVVQCSQDNGDQSFYDSETGDLLYSGVGLGIITWGENYYWTEYDGINHLLFGKIGGEIKELYPNGDGTAIPIPAQNGVLTQEYDEGGYLLDFYELSAGSRRASVQLPQDITPASYQAQGEDIWFLDLNGGTLYQWNLKASDPEDPAVYTNRRFTDEDPELDGLAQISQQAKQFGQRFGVEILVWDQIEALEPEDYALVRAYSVGLYRRALKQLEEVLSQFPDGMLRQAADCQKPLMIALVQEIRGTQDSVLTAAGGLQYWQEDCPCIVLAMEDALTNTLYHELEHLLDNYIFAHTDYLDNWASLNPEGFTYDYDYIRYQQEYRGEYLDGVEQAFVDDYSMTFPKEDRARILEYAVQPDRQAMFQAPYLQKKLSVLCKAIRDTFQVDSQTSLLWEQYLSEETGSSME